MKTTNRYLALAFGLLLLVIVLLPFVIGMLMGNRLAPGMMGSGMMGSGMMSPGTMGSGMMGSGMIAIMAALIIGGLLLLRSLTEASSRRGETGTTPLELLQRRYVTGDITQTDYERMRQELLPTTIQTH